MLLRLRLIMLLFVLFVSGSAQAQQYVWSRKAIDSLSFSFFWNNTSCNNCNGVIQGTTTNPVWYGSAGKRNSTVDANGNTYVVGGFAGSIKIGNTVLTSNNSNNCALCGWAWAGNYCFDIYVAKYDSSGNAIWAVSAGGTEMDVANAITVDQQGYVYIAGAINGTNAIDVKFGPNLKLNPQGQDGFVAKISPSGQWVWAHKLTGSSDECAAAVKVDRYGNCYVAGSGSGFIKVSSSFTASTPAFNGGRDVFVAKIDPSGAPLWMKSGGGTADDYPSDLSTDNSGGVYVSLNLRGDFTYYTTASTISLTGSGSTPYGALLKLNQSGIPVWAVKAGTHVMAITNDIYANTIITGVYNTTTTFGSTTYTPFAAGKHDIFICKVDGAGNYVWAKRIGSDENKTTTSWDCTTWTGGVSGDWSSDIEVDGAGNVYVSGTLVDDTEPGSVVNVTRVKYYPYWSSNYYKRAGFVIKINADGSSGWNIRTRGYWGCNENVNGIGLDNYGNMYFSGTTYIYTWAPYYLPLAIYINNDTVAAGTLGSNFTWGWGAYYFGEYLSRIRNTEVVYIKSVDKQAYCVGDSMFVDYVALGNYAPGNQFILELSDTNGEFNTPLVLATKTSTQSGTFRVKISPTMAMGTGYRVRVNSSLPNVTGYPNNKYIIISTYPNAALGLDKTICAGDSIQITAGDGWYYDWTPSAKTSSSTAKAPYLKTGTTQEYVMKTSNPGGCSDWDTLMVNVVPRPKATITGTLVICNKDTTTLQALSGNGTKFVWTPNYRLNSDTLATVRANPVVDTTYTVKVSNAYCSDTTMVRVKINPLPIVQNLSDTSICYRDSVRLFFTSNATNNSWSPVYNLTDPNDGTIILYPDTSSRYVLTSTSDKGCVLKSNLKVNVIALPKITLISDTFTCYNIPIQLKATGSTIKKFNWQPDATIKTSDTLGNVNIQTKIQKHYVVKAFDGRCSDTAGVLLHVWALPPVSAGTDTSICVGAQAGLQASGANTYVWDPGPFISNPNTATPTVTPQQTSWFKVNGTDGNGCVNRDSVKVLVNPLPVVQTSPDPLICPGQKTPLLASGGNDFLWLPADYFISNPNIPNPDVFPIRDTIYKVRVTDLNGCVQWDSIFVKLRIPPAVSAGTDLTICRGDSAALSGSSPTATSYQWEPPTSVGSVHSQITKASPVQTTTYVLHVKDASNCSGYDTVQVNVLQLPLVNASDDKTICQRDSVYLEANSTTGISFQWLNAGGGVESNAFDLLAKPSISTQYTVTTFDGKCRSLPEPVNVKVEAVPTARFTVDQTEGKPPFEIKLTNTSIGKDIVSYLWDFGDTLGTSTSTEPQYTYHKPGLYTIRLKVTTANNCHDEYVFGTIQVYERSFVFIPTSFTPNNDGLNDKFEVSVNEMNWLRVSIYNRWGEMVYQESWERGQTQQGWDGRYKGQLVMDGSYIYSIESKGLDGQYRYNTGEVTLIY